MINTTKLALTILAATVLNLTSISPAGAQTAQSVQPRTDNIVARLELESGVKIEFVEPVPGMLGYVETGPIGNEGSLKHLSAMSPVELYRTLAPNGNVPQSLLDAQGRFDAKEQALPTIDSGIAVSATTEAWESFTKADSQTLVAGASDLNAEAPRNVAWFRGYAGWACYCQNPGPGVLCVQLTFCRTERTGTGSVAYSGRYVMENYVYAYRGSIRPRLQWDNWGWKTVMVVSGDGYLKQGYYIHMAIKSNNGPFGDTFRSIVDMAEGDGYHHAGEGHKALLGG